MNDSQLEAFLEPLGEGSSWAAKCVRRLLEAENLTDIAAGLVAQNGHKPVELVKNVWNAWGIDMKTCHSYCGRSNFPMVFDFPIFTSGVTNYLLPWLGLTAQLPYETGSPSGNFESFCLAVGSPMLTTFSLMSTVRNARTTSNAFDVLLKDNAVAHRNERMKKAIESARDFLCDSQQSPIRIQDDEFRKLFEGDEEYLQDHWESLAKRLSDTRRPYTFSFFAQTFFAVSAWVLTIVGSYVTSLGQHSEALLLSSGTLWTWLVPVVLGWMAVGTQSRPDTVHDAIQGGKTCERCTPLKALEAKSGFMGPTPTVVEDALLGKVQGDEACQGPIYNYARIFTNTKLRDMIVSAFDKKIQSLRHRELQRLPSRPENQDSAHASVSNVSSSGSRLIPTEPQPPARTNTNERQTDPDFNRIEPYMKWTEVRRDTHWTWNFIISNAVAVFLQWGVTGSATVISYLTEVRGLGCRSGSYLLYGILATSAHVLLVASVFLSHHVMLLYQDQPKPYKTTVKFQIRWVGRLAVALRFLGKSMAVVNAVWIILSSVFELIGFYESCWCTGTVLGLGSRAWVVLFVSGDKMREDAEASWIGGLAMSLFTMIFTYFVSKAYAQGRKD
ncbi:unnamed protein product [Alternaria burnsii]|nr:unnamed protein product [Alternaria burnsii]